MGLLWELFGRNGPSGFGYSSTAEEVTEGLDASNLTAIVTGATSGLGKETARVLAKRGATVIIPARSKESGMKLKESLLVENPNANLHVMEMDLSSLGTVESFARSFNTSYKRLNILINNAGIMGGPFQLSADGFELQFATNHLGHFLLTNLLLDKLKSTAKETGIEGRIVNVSSMAHRFGDSFKIGFENFSNPTKYAPYDAYSRSKLANILHANELSRRLQEEGSNVTANSLHPGVIPTNIYRAGSFSLNWFKFFIPTVSQGAATICYLALHPNVRGVSGKYFNKCNENSPSALASNEELGKRLWDFSEELVQTLGKPK